jgi:hypothetical protein
MPPPNYIPPKLSLGEFGNPHYKSSPQYSKKIGMNLGIEYLVRSGLVRGFLEFPCSIFVKSASDDKIVVTINEANTQNDKHAVLYSVRNWFVSDCDEKQPIPSMEETIVRDVDLFIDPAVVLPGFSPLYFDCNSLEWKRNRGNDGHPMPDYIYEDYFNKMLFPTSHKVKKESFLWNCFTTAYIPSIRHMVNDEMSIEYMPGYMPSLRRKSKNKAHSVQQKLVERNFKTIWQAWLKWSKFMLFDTVPGELIFMRDYSQLA